MIIRRATIEDAPAIAEVLVEGWRFAFSDFMPPEVLGPGLDFARRTERIASKWEVHGRNFVACNDDGRVIGFGGEQDPPQLAGIDAEVGGLYVHTDFARAGVGRAILSHMCELFAAEGKRSLGIHTLELNQIGRAFYDKLGGQIVAQDDWHGMVAVWYRWDDLRVLAASKWDEATKKRIQRKAVAQSVQRLATASFQG